jgi:CRP-like cAMP-binding protein
LLEAISEEERRAVLARCRRQRYAKAEVVFRQGDTGDCLHLLAVGTVAVRVSTPLGDVATLEVLRPGDAFGEQALISAAAPARSATVVALEPCETMRLTRSDFDELLDRYPAVAQLLIQVLDTRLRQTSQNLLNALYLSTDARVFRWLAILAEIYTGHASAAIPLTQDDLATMAGTTRQTVNKVLRQAQDDGLLTLSRGRIAVTDAAELVRRAH